MNVVIGTAGHVDHGKSTLVEALTGIDPDRLAEEKEREMTIDLGFAWLTLPDGRSVGIVDVPGHRDFIKNMLAGVGGIDLVLLVIAADEGIMPQTREHLQILDLLNIEKGIVALTKIDLVDDPEWLGLVQSDIHTVLQGTRLEASPIVPVSARTGEGLDDLLATLEVTLAYTSPRANRGRSRLPVDRVFSISGFGTVVTGTLVDGTFAVGDEVEIIPGGRQARIRGLQSHKESVETIPPGSRVAINLSGVDKQQIKRGDIIAAPGAVSGTTLIDVSFRHLPTADRPLTHNAEIRFFSHAAESTGTIRLIGESELKPGAEGWLQIRLEEPIGLIRGDRYILRRPSPPETIGGGMILDPHPEHRWRRFKPEVLERFETLAAGTPDQLILHILEEHTAVHLVSLAELIQLPEHAVAAIVEPLIDSGEIVTLRDGSLMAGTRWQRIAGQIAGELEQYQKKYPLQLGMPREAFRSRLNLSGKLFGAIVEQAAESGLLIDESITIRTPDHMIRYTPAQQEAINELRALIRANPTKPPSVKEAAAIVGEDVIHGLLTQGELVQANADVFFDAETYQSMVEQVQEAITAGGSITVAQARDLFGTSRKYVLALLEHLDAIGVTRREGDQRTMA